MTTPEPTALMDAHALVKILSLQVPHIPIHVLVNRSEGPAQGQHAFTRLAAASEQFLDRRLHLAGVLLEESPIAAAVREPRHFLARLMQTRAAQTIRETRLDRLTIAEPTRSRV